MDTKLSKIYYSPKCYWKGLAAVKKLAAVAKVAEDVAKRWLTKQAIGKYISQRHATFLGQSLTSSRPMQCIKQTFFFCPMISFLMEERFTNTV